MTFTYAVAGTELTDLEKVRGMIGDTDSTDPLLTDEQITPVITANVVLTRAAAACITKIMGKLARRAVDRRIGSTSISASQMMKHYAELRAILMADGGDTAPSGGTPLLTPIAGGISVSENQRLEADTNLVPPPLGHGQDDFPGNAMDARPTDNPEDDWTW